jgi:hypothetical protein
MSWRYLRGGSIRKVLAICSRGQGSNELGPEGCNVLAVVLGTMTGLRSLGLVSQREAGWVASDRDCK